MSASLVDSPLACLGLVLPSVPGGLSGGIDRDEASLDPSSRSIPPFVSCGPDLKNISPDSSRPAPASSPGVSLASSALFLEDPVARALGYPMKDDLADASRTDKFDADWELSLLPAGGFVSFPVTGEGRSLPDRETDAANFSNSRPYQAPSLYPVRPPCGKVPVSLKTSAASNQSVLDFRSVSFPPLPKSGGTFKLPQAISIPYRSCLPCFSPGGVSLPGSGGCFCPGD